MKKLILLFTLLLIAATAFSATVKLRGDTAANWTSANPTLAARELGLETDTRKIKIGDGGTAWTSLDYLADATGGGVTATEGTVSLGTAAIASEACATVVQATVSNHLVSDSFSWAFQGDVTGVTGYVPSTDGVLTIYAYSTAGYLNWKVCNMTADPITPGAVTINWQVIQ